MTRATVVPSSESASKRRTPKRRRKIKRVMQPLKYRPHEQSQWVPHATIVVHSAALQLPELDASSLSVLRAQIIRDDGTLNLATKIVITHGGAIIDGRHRARILVEAGHGDHLASQIRAKGGEWVEVLPANEDPLFYVARTQIGQRNCRPWRTAVMVMQKYNEAAAKGEKLRGGDRSSRSPVEEWLSKQRGDETEADAFCDDLDGNCDLQGVCDPDDPLPRD